MIPRYSRPEMAAVWSEERKLAAWQEVEVLAAEAWAEQGKVPGEAAAAIRARGPVDVESWKAREQVTHHDVAAFVDVMADGVPGGEWIHYGLTSSDVVDTAQAVVMRDAADLLIDEATHLMAAIRHRAFEHRDTVMVGRTHGIWAEPTTFGLKLAGWVFELARNIERLRTAREVVATGKISGAVGTYAHVPAAVETFVCDRLSLAVEPASTQVTARDRHAQFLQAIALTGASLERFATEIRHLQRSEVGEAMESFTAGQKGSSAMPHKRNPILSERVCGLARVLRGYAQVGLENVALWHERDISHSSAERIVLPDACLALDYMLVLFRRVVDGLVVDTDRMNANLEQTRGLVYSQAVLLALIDNGSSRAEAYDIVQRNALATWTDGGHLRERLAADPDLGLTPAALDACFDPKRVSAGAVVVFDRLAALADRQPG